MRCCKVARTSFRNYRSEKMKRYVYYILSYTWGLPLTFIGLFLGAVLLVLGYKPKRWLYGHYFEVGEDWGGFNAGPIFFCCRNNMKSLKNHEFGHSLQNCVFGIFTIFIISNFLKHVMCGQYSFQ